MSYGFRASRTRPDKVRHTMLAGNANRIAIRDSNNTLVSGIAAIVEDSEGFFGEVSFIANKEREGHYVGHGRSLLFYDGKPLRWIIPIEIQPVVAPERYRNNGRAVFVPGQSDIVTGVPGIVHGNEENSPIELKRDDQTMLEHITEAIKIRLPWTVFEKIRQQKTLQRRFSEDYAAIMECTDFYSGKIAIPFSF